MGIPSEMEVHISKQFRKILNDSEGQEQLSTLLNNGNISGKISLSDGSVYHIKRVGKRGKMPRFSQPELCL